MSIRSKPRIAGIAAIIVMLFVSICVPSPVRADVAPPDQPSGSNVDPGDEITQVRMVAETVIISVLKSYPAASQGQASVNASFVMRNLGDVEEQLDVRFPLAEVHGYGDGFGNMPEITDLRVKVDDAEVATHRMTTENPGDFIDTPIPWAVFPVAFPPGQDVTIEVVYTAEGTAWDYDPAVRFAYILETGAGWKGTIGSADIIVRLPYEANAKNVVLDSSGFRSVGAEPVINGQDMRWHLENFEPDANNNFQVYVVKPDIWLRVLIESKNVKNNPHDGEAWGRLGKAYKNVIDWGKYYRSDPAGLEMYRLSDEAYRKALALLPDDALWHYGYADLLYGGYLWVYNDDNALLLHVVQELSVALQLDPTNQDILNLVDEVSMWRPDWVQKTESGYVFLALTAFPAPSSTAAPVSTPLSTPRPSATPVPVEPNPSKTPLCGAALLPLIVTGAFWLKSRFFRA